MFAVKATYRSETRKFTFSEDTFPSFDKLNSQIYKVFPVANAYFISRLIFSPNPRAPGQAILVGLEAHSAEEYDKHVAQYQGRSWPGALLKFTVLDETPHKSPVAPAASQTAAEVTLVSRPSSIVFSDVSETPGSASKSTVPGIRYVEDELNPSESERSFMLDTIRERIRSRAASYASNRNSTASTITVRVLDDDTTERDSFDSYTEVSEATPRLGSRLPPVSSATRLSQIMRKLHVDSPRSEDSEPSSSAAASDRMARLQESIVRMRDQSIRLREATEVLKERSTALRKQSWDDIRALSPVSDTSTATSENTVQRASPKPEQNTAAEQWERDILSRVSQMRQSEEDLKDINRRDGYWRDRFVTQLMASQDRLEGQSIVSSPALTVPSLVDAESSSVSHAEEPVSPSVNDSERTFDEASQRTVNLGLELLRRTSSYSTLRDGEGGASDGAPEDSSDEEEPTWARTLPHSQPASVPGAADERERSRLSLLSRLATRRPLPPCPISASPVWLPPCGNTRSPSPAYSQSRSPSPQYEQADISVAAAPVGTSWSIPERPVSTSTMSYRSYSPMFPVCQPPPLPPKMHAPYSVASSPFTPPVNCMPWPTMPVGRACWSPPPPLTAVEHSCGWSAECDKLKRQIDDVQGALADLRCDFERAVSDKQLGTGQAEAPAAQTAAGGSAERLGHASTSPFPPPFPPGFIPNPISSSIYTPFAYPWRMPPPPPLFPDTSQFVNINEELFKIESSKLPMLKAELSIAHKDLPSLTIEDKSRLVGLAKARGLIPMLSRGSDILIVPSPPVQVRVHPPMTPSSIPAPIIPDFQPQAAAMSHPNIFCDGCDRPITGVRHKCLDCPNFDLCSECLNSPQIRKGHSARHAFFPLDIPGDKTTFEAVQSDRKGIEHYGITCDGCHTRVHGVRHKCIECPDFDLCEKCVSTISVRYIHQRSHHFFPIEFPWDQEAFRVASSEVKDAAAAPKVVHYASCDGCNKVVEGVRHRCLVCSDFDFCSECMGDPEKRFTHDLSHSFFPITQQSEREGFDSIRTRISSTTDGPVVHTNIVCDQCDDIIIGVRHKCLDCVNYDLCGDCVAQGAKRNHSSAHQFFEITKPGEVIVHTVLSDEPPRPSMPEQPSTPAAQQPVVHNAVCNLCDSTIRGDRYKCLNCPDFDTCHACFVITPEHHPGHGFVKVACSDNLLLRDILRSHVIHSARCNECDETIRGTRYKCLHQDCPDYDLCQNCEAMPIAVHPLTHPLVKLKVPEAEIPTTEATATAIPRPRGLPVIIQSPDSPLPSPVPNVGKPSWANWQPLGEYVPSPVSECADLPSAPLIPPLIPASWTPPESWRWNLAPPAPRMISEETTPLFRDYTGGRRATPSISEAAPSLPSSPPFLPPPLPCTMPLVSPVVRFEEPLPIPPPCRDHASSERVASPILLPLSPPAKVLIDLDEPSIVSDSGAPSAVAPSSLQGLMTPSEDNDLSSGLVQPAPRIEPAGEQEWRELWPELTTMLRHLLQPASPPAVDAVVSDLETMPGAMTTEDIPETQAASTSTQEFRTAVEESPLAGEALLSRPIPAEMTERSRDFGHNLLELLNRVGPVPTLPIPPTVAPVRHQATYVSDNNIADGQIFPPGAEFVKSWIMRNDGETAWPEETTLRYVAGDRMAPTQNAALRVPVGCVLPGAEVELAGGEMKAPDVPDKYVSYWRLHDGREYFGNSVWVDIEVAESTHNEDASEESLAASSVIMPPAPSAGAETRASAGISAPPSTTVLSGPPSDDGSFDSSMSLIDAPSSPSIEGIDDDEDLFQDSREIVVSPIDAPRDIEYVVLYDTSSSEDEQ